MRKTVGAPIVLEGRGLHSGEPTRVTIHPGEHGIAFRYNGQRWNARPEEVTETTRCTKLGEVSTIEHLMSAFCGLEITDAEVELTFPELPGLDGSSRPYVAELSKFPLQNIAESEFFTPFKRVYAHIGDVKIAMGRGRGHWDYEYATDDRWPFRQRYESTDVVRDYAQEIAPARTFALAEEIPMIVQHGLGKGLDENSAVIVGDGDYKNDVRFPDEPARHKLLDLMGDLYLAGVPASLLNVSAVRSGHRTNVASAALLLEHVLAEHR